MLTGQQDKPTRYRALATITEGLVTPILERQRLRGEPGFNNWPPYSPDLNPIEHAWVKLKERIYLPHPDLEPSNGTKEQLKEPFFKAMKEAWESVGQGFFDGLVRSMEKRVNAILRGKRVVHPLL